MKRNAFSEGQIIHKEITNTHRYFSDNQIKDMGIPVLSLDISLILSSSLFPIVRNVVVKILRV